MKKISKRWIFIALIVLAVLLMIPTMAHYIASNRYYPDVETAVINTTTSKNLVEIATVMGEEGVVYIAFGDNDSILAYTFYTRIMNGNVTYKLARGVTLKAYLDNNAIKMDTTPGSTEQIVLVIGQALANEYAKKTGIHAEYIPFEHDGNQYAIWYIISANGLEELPDLQLSADGVSSAVFEKSLTTDNYIALAALLGIITIVVTFKNYIRRRFWLL